MRIGFRTVKTAVGVSLSVLIAQWLQLEYYSAAGILTLLCIQKSRKQSIKAATSRFFACMMGLFFATGLFELVGYRPYAFLILLLLFIPLCVRLRIQEGIASSSVIVMHVYINREVEASFFLNELLVVVVGLGVALLINWYMPSIDKQLQRYKAESDRLIAVILNEIANYLKNGYTLWDGSELLQLSELLSRARSAAALDAENHLARGNEYGHYFETKRKQFELLERMLPAVSRVNVQIEQGRRIGDFVIELIAHMNKPGYADTFYDMLRAIREYHKLLPLPETRDEFENRANLYAVANELERFVDTLD
ncbi:MAG TPA: aromatic acid exporter family protein [Paenibacillus sp.]|uniref:aromatic acid exporter family protein n=1 Tax=Paenibacillus sp. TaxID=58172 RepID=UPI002C457E4B|nr:aromatic acid exporter family protein [Paenibacillus sp.]HUC92083.1 aromatic acid exporter family protein [Paenibacillus sp.]